jgi:D-alanyl-D-alanine carboxypeptidase (penicillin-binding protein 5/6)
MSRRVIRPVAGIGLFVLAMVAIGPSLWSAPDRDRGAEAAGPAAAVPSCGPNAQGGDVLPSGLPVRDPAAAPPPPITAKAAVVLDAETGRVLYGLDEHYRRSPASTTKIMTAILALENRPLDDLIVAESDALTMSAAGSSVMGLAPGTSISMRDLLYGLMLPSGNDAALDIARAIDSGSVSTFVDRMNAKAADLHLVNTSFRNPHGLSRKGHYSSAYDLAMLTRYAMANEEFRRIVSTQAYHLSPPSDYDLFNGNSLLATYPGADGVKIGWTEQAGWTFVASAVRDGRRVIVTVLHSDDRDADAAALFDWAFTSHRWQTIGPQTAAMLSVFNRFGLGQALGRSLAVCS